VLEKRKAIFINDVAADSKFSRQQSIIELELLSVMCIPLITTMTNEIVGVIYLDSRSSKQTFGEKDVDLISAIAKQAAISIENARLYEKVEKDREEMENLYQRVQQDRRDLSQLFEIGKAISSVLDLDKLLTLIVDAVIDITEAERGFLMLKKEDPINSDRSLEFRIARNQKKQTLDRSEFTISFSIANSVLNSGEPILLSDIEEENELVPTSSMMYLELKSVICVPLKTAKDVLGVIYVDNSIAKSNFSDRELNLLSTLSSEAAIAVEKAMLYDDLQKAHKNLLKLDEMKTKFVNLASHELRTPLTVITGYLFLLKRPEKLQTLNVDIFGTIRKNVEKLNAIVSNIFDLSKLTKPEYNIKKSKVSIPKLIQEVEKEMRPFLQQREHKLDIILPEDELVAEIDYDSIWQALINLVLNAIKFTPNGGEIRIEGYSKASEIEIRVVDNGIGIPEAEFDNIFKSFYEIDEVSHHSSGDAEFMAGGLGVGLSIAKSAVELHGGRIWVESEIGNGSTFSFTIPKK
jgi:signal transduction histidine kinase